MPDLPLSRLIDDGALPAPGLPAEPSRPAGVPDKRAAQHLAVTVLIGTRPEAIKMAPVVSALQKRPRDFTVQTILSSQHGRVCRSALAPFGVVPDLELTQLPPFGGMPPQPDGRSIADFSGQFLARFDRCLAESAPDIVLVQGDTATAMMGALAAFYRRIPVAHVEAGLRSHDMGQPFPEEANRRMIGVLASLNFAPTAMAADCLVRENVAPGRIILTGNTVVDAVNHLRGALPPGLCGEPALAPLADFDPARERLVLVTAHRRENWGEPLRDICRAVTQLAAEYPAARFVFPVHPNPAVGEIVRGELGALANVCLLPPLDYFPLMRVMQAACLLLTDSGGLQEEAPSFALPAIVLREATERMESVELGLSHLTGADPARILPLARRYLDASFASGETQDHGKFPNPYGDGNASERIAETLRRWSALENRVDLSAPLPQLMTRMEQFVPPETSLLPRADRP